MVFQTPNFVVFVQESVKTYVESPDFSFTTVPVTEGLRSPSETGSRGRAERYRREEPRGTEHLCSGVRDGGGDIEGLGGEKREYSCGQYPKSWSMVSRFGPVRAEL